ncbi:Phage shock protein PspC (stress-responsive transcriptional regulator) [Amycolatopsis xylanica]|uniref:Phage shock protein PspC (Stress-responsive transcriptional regulator) n=1 Tax=Amycolatopsis xylanica TaxID=589385 RepID=A0A1H2YLX5_9PSEU|nr:PspC domain-containing protein [Amycolatopsis xylanica]SDX06213.1 Phage shock protein PspC (stress-responsive transcriptional regulator) [Amycolatopsis xylanica]
MTNNVNFSETFPTTTTAAKPLFRSSTDRKLGGVCAGWAQYFGIDPTAVRVLMAIATFVLMGMTIPIYAAAWILTPAEEAASDAHLDAEIPVPA